MSSLRFLSTALSLVLAATSAGPIHGLAQTALVRHAPTLNGGVEGSVQQMTAENVTLNGGAFITGELSVPGTPSVRLNGNPRYGGIIAGAGSATPANHQVTLNGGALLGRLHTRTDPANLPAVAAPPQPTGTRSVSINSAGQNPGDFSTLRNLTLNGNAGVLIVPPGAYGNFISNGSSRLVLGIAGTNRPVAYHFQNLTLNGGNALEIVGPVIVTVNGGFSTNSSMGSPAHPEWLTLRISGGGLSLNGDGSFHGYLEAPAGTLTLNGNTRFTGGVVCDRLIINGNSLLKLTAATAVNQAPTVTLTAPGAGATQVFPSAITLSASAADADGTVAAVEFNDGATRLGEGRAVGPSTYELKLPNGLPLGSHTLTAKATDNLGASTVSAPVSITVVAPANRAPEVTVTGPAPGSVHVAAEPFNLTARVVDADGRIVRVELYRDDDLVGTLTEPSTPPYEFNFSTTAPALAGNHVFRVRAYDNGGAAGDSAPLSIVVMPRLPYLANFEANEGYKTGPLNGQLGWVVTQGLAAISGTAVFDGARAVELQPGERGARVTQSFAAPSAPEIEYVDLFMRPAAAFGAAEGSVLELGGAQVAFRLDGIGGQFFARDAGSPGAGEWVPAGGTVPLDAKGVASRWVRITTRLNYQEMTWDLYVDGRLVLIDLGLEYAVPPPRGMTALSLQGLATQASHFDFLYASGENPLFADVDRDGMDDAWELASGLDPAIDDRTGDLDGDGLTNLFEYLLGTKADRADTDGDGMPDGWEWRRHLDPLVPAAEDVDSDHDGLPDRQEFAAGTNPLSSDTDADGLPDGWELAHGFNPLANDSLSDADGDGRSNLEEFRQGSDPHDFFNGLAPQAEALNGGGPGTEDELSMVVLKPDGTPWPNAPAEFRITSGTRRISATRNGPVFGLSISVHADSSGVAKAYLEPYQP